MGRLLRWSGRLIVAATLCVAAVLFVGRTLTPPADAVLSRTCPTPCWQGLIPGQTVFADVEALITSRAPFLTGLTYSTITRLRTVDRELCWDIRATRLWQGCAQRESRRNDGPITHVQLNPPVGGFTLGDALIRYGRPIGALACVRFTGRVRVHITVDVYFSGNVQVRAYNEPDATLLRTTPEMIVSLVRYHALADEPPYRFDLPAWNGFRALQENKGC